MKKILLRIFTLVGLVVGLQSCNEDIEITGNFVETPVIHGLLDQSDSLHFIKITRAFIGPGNAIEIAKIPDSNYFASVSGTVMEFTDGNYSLNANGEFNYNINDASRTFNLRDTLVSNKDTDGIFYAPQQKLYYFPTSSSAPLIGNALYVLDVSINGGDFSVKGETKLVDGIQSNVAGQSQPLKFIDNATLSYKPSTVVISNTGSSRQVNTTLKVHFTEWVGSTPTQRSFDWKIGEYEVESNSSQTFQASGSTFYELIKGNCSSNSAITRRTFDGVTFTFTGGSEDLVNYIQVNKPTSTLAQSKPEFTNLVTTKDHPVVGIFSSRQTLSVYKPFIDPSDAAYIRVIDKASTRSLCSNSITGSFLFCSDHPGDNIVGSEEAFACP